MTDPFVQNGYAMRNRIPDTDHHEPRREDIAVLAYKIWEKQGHPEGRAVKHWNLATDQLRARRLAELNRVVRTENKIRNSNRLPVLRGTIGD